MPEENGCENLQQEEISFVECVRRRRVAVPIYKSFDRDEWKNSYEVHRKDDACDALFWAGLSIFNALASLRDRYDALLGQADVDFYVRSLVGLGNREERRLRARAIDNLSRHGIVPALNEMVELKLLLDSGSEHSAEELSSIVVESLTKAVGERLRQPQFDLRAGHLSTFEACVLDVNICGTYRLLESLWHDCLWNGYGFTVTEGGPGFTAAPITEQSGLDAAWRTLSEYRREILRGSRIATALMSLRRSDPDEKFRSVPCRLVISIERDAKGHVFGLAAANEAQAADIAEQAFLALDEIRHEPYEHVLDQPMSKLRGSCVRQLIAAWLVIRSISTTESTTDAEPRVVSSESLISFTCVYSHEEINNVVSAALSVGIEEARGLVNFMLFDGSRQQTLWTHPLIRLPSGGVCLLSFAIKHANLRYVLERWLKILEVNVSKKGNPFEEKVRQRLMSGRRSNALAGNLQVLQSRFKFRAVTGGHESEEIDLVMIFGKTVVLGEVKCSITPTESVDFFKNRNIISFAVNQIKTKADFVGRNRGAFVKALAKRGVAVPEDFKTIQVVVVNNPIYVGRVVDGVPVVDLLVLERYLEGFIAESGRFDKDGVLVAEHVLIFYRNIDEAQLNFERYLNGLPQLRFFTSEERVVEIPVGLLTKFPRIFYRTFSSSVDRKKISELRQNSY